MTEREFIVKIAEMTRAAKLKENHYEAEISSLNQRIADLEEDNRTLLQLLAYVMRNNAPSVVVREDELKRPFQFHSGTNMAGEPTLAVKITIE